MNQIEFDWMKNLESKVDAAWDSLTAWEQEFVESLLERFRLYGIKTRMSPNQWERIREIYDSKIV